MVFSMYQKLIKGLAVYRQNHTKSYYVRLRVDGQEIKRSLKTSDLDEAISKAWALKFETEGMVKAGLSIMPNKKNYIETACNAVIEQLEKRKPQKPIYKDYIYIYNNFIIPHFYKKEIDELTTKNIRLYFENNEFSKTRKTINKTCFTMLFNYLEEEDLLKKKDFPSLPKQIKTTQNKIGHDILEDDLNAIRDYINSEDFLNPLKANFKTKEYRLLFPHYFEFLLNTGIRTGEEIENLRFSDLTTHNKLFYAKVRKGKTKEHGQRDILINQKAMNALLSFVEITKNQKITENQLKTIKDDFIFRPSFLTGQSQFGKLFSRIVKDLLEQGKIKKEYTLYACRHTYITKALLHDDRDMYLIAKQVGNSLEMIQKHYDHVMLKDTKNIDSLSGKKRPVRF